MSLKLLQGECGQGRESLVAGVISGLFGLAQETDHRRGPALLGEALDEADQLAQVVSVAEGVQARVAVVGRPVVMDQNAGVVRQQTERLQGGLAALGMGRR